MKKNGLVLITLFISILSFAQKGMDVEYLFKVQLFVDRPGIKNDSLYNIFMKNISIKIDTLKTSIPFSEKYQFYRLSLKDEKNVSYAPGFKVPDDDGAFLFDFSHGYTSDYILCIDIKNGICFRLLGFNSNDFLSFLTDYKETYTSLSDKDILELLKVEGLDFKCLYKALRTKNLKRVAFPCLESVNDPIRVY